MQIPYYSLWKKYKIHLSLCIYTTGIQMVILSGFLFTFMFIKSSNSSQLPLDWLLI